MNNDPKVVAALMVEGRPPSPTDAEGNHIKQEKHGKEKKRILSRVLDILDIDFTRADLEEASKLLKAIGVESIDLDLAVNMIDKDVEGAKKRITGPTDRGTGFGVKHDIMNALGEIIAENIENNIIMEVKREVVGASGEAEPPEGKESGPYTKKELKNSWDEFARKELKMGAVDKDFIDVGRKKIRVVYYLHDGSRYYEANIDDESNWNVHYQCYRAYRRGPGGMRKGGRGD
jgi:hypothetical protein